MVFNCIYSTLPSVYHACRHRPTFYTVDTSPKQFGPEIRKSNTNHNEQLYYTAEYTPCTGLVLQGFIENIDNNSLRYRDVQGLTVSEFDNRDESITEYCSSYGDAPLSGGVLRAISTAKIRYIRGHDTRIQSEI